MLYGNGSRKWTWTWTRRRFVACSGLFNVFLLALLIFPFFNLLPFASGCFLSLAPFDAPPNRSPGLAEGKLFGVSSAAHQFLLLTSKSCNTLSPRQCQKPATHLPHHALQCEYYSTIGSQAVLPAVYWLTATDKFLLDCALTFLCSRCILRVCSKFQLGSCSGSGRLHRQFQ